MFVAIGLASIVAAAAIGSLGSERKSTLRSIGTTAISHG
jgi:hypothetical protein